MKLFNIFKKKWKSPNWLTRMKAIEALQNQNILLELAQKDPNRYVRKAAMEKLDNSETLLKIISSSSKSEIKKEAINLLNESAPINKIKDPHLLSLISSCSLNESIQENCLNQLEKISPEEYKKSRKIRDTGEVKVTSPEPEPQVEIELDIQIESNSETIPQPGNEFGFKIPSLDPRTPPFEKSINKMEPTEKLEIITTQQYMPEVIKKANTQKEDELISGGKFEELEIEEIDYSLDPVRYSINGTDDPTPKQNPENMNIRRKSTNGQSDLEANSFSKDETIEYAPHRHKNNTESPQIIDSPSLHPPKNAMDDAITIEDFFASVTKGSKNGNPETKKQQNDDPSTNNKKLSLTETNH